MLIELLVTSPATVAVALVVGVVALAAMAFSDAHV